MSSLHQLRPLLDEQTYGVGRSPYRGLTGAPRALISASTRLYNPLIQRFAGSRYFPLFALVRHHGRRSGRSYVTPIGALPTPNGFVIPLSLGEEADWFHNVQAAGGCVIRWRGAEYPEVEPEVLDWATARPAIPRVERIALRLLGITGFARLRHVLPQRSGHV